MRHAHPYVPLTNFEQNSVRYTQQNTVDALSFLPSLLGRDRWQTREKEADGEVWGLPFLLEESGRYGRWRVNEVGVLLETPAF